MKLAKLSPAQILTVGLLTAFTLGCGTYRTGSGEYHGMGTYRPPSDYSDSSDTSNQVTSEDQMGARGKLSPRSQYIPHAPFKLHWPVSQVRVNRGFHPPLSCTRANQSASWRVM